jgi:hypothetical protein
MNVKVHGVCKNRLHYQLGQYVYTEKLEVNETEQFIL